MGELMSSGAIEARLGRMIRDGEWGSVGIGDMGQEL